MSKQEETYYAHETGYLIAKATAQLKNAKEEEKNKKKRMTTIRRGRIIIQTTRPERWENIR